MVMEITVTAQVFDLEQLQNRGAAQAVATETYSVPTRVITMPVAQEAQPVETYSYSYDPMPVAEVATAGDIVLSHFDVDANGEWDSEERLAARLQLRMKDECFGGDIAAMSDWLESHGFTSPMSLEAAGDALEMYQAESTS